MSTTSINYYYLNLDRSPDRRVKCEEQARAFGLPLIRVEAVDGARLGGQLPPEYDPSGSMFKKPRLLTAGEHGCVLSHKKALEQFLASEASFGVIFEDDVRILPHTQSTIDYLVNHTTGWECIKLCTKNGAIHSVMKRDAGLPCELIAAKTVLWSSVANLYTREGAAHLLEALQAYTMPFDVQLARTFLSKGYPICATFPNVVTGWDMDCIETSMLDRGDESKEPKASLFHYFRYRLYVWGIAWNKIRMRRRLKRCLRLK